MEAKGIFERLQGKFGEQVFEHTEGAGVKDPFCKVKQEALPEVARFLRDEPDLRFDFLQCVTAVDWIKQGVIQVVYHLYSYPQKHGYVVKVDAPRSDPVVPSVSLVWPTANWHEREQFDLFGVQFSGHPDLRRLMMPDDWDGHPMRKDYKEGTSYRGMPTTRYSPTELFAEYYKAHPQPEGQRPAKVEEKPAAAKPAAAKAAAAGAAKPAAAKPDAAKPAVVPAPAATAPAEAKPPEKPVAAEAPAEAQSGTPTAGSMPGKKDAEQA